MGFNRRIARSSRRRRGLRPPNQTPIVDAGSPNVVAGQDFDLNGSAIDDDESLTYLWVQLDGPGTATFDDDTDPGTSGSVDVDGTYTFQLAASDGERIGYDTVTWTFDATAPAFSNFRVRADGLAIEADASEAMAGGAGDPSQFSLDGCQQNPSVTGFSITAGVATWPLDAVIVDSDNPTFSYDIGTDPLVDSVGNQAATITDEACTNNSTVSPADPNVASTPTISFESSNLVSGAEVDITSSGAGWKSGTYDGSQFTLTIGTYHNTHKTQQCQGTVTVSGGTARLNSTLPIPAGATVTAAYTKGGDPLLDNNDLEVDSFNGLSVTNGSEYPVPVECYGLHVPTAVEEGTGGNAGKLVRLDLLVSGISLSTPINGYPAYGNGVVGTGPGMTGSSSTNVGLSGDISSHTALLNLLHSATPSHTFVLGLDPNGPDNNGWFVGFYHPTVSYLGLLADNTGNGRLRYSVSDGTLSPAVSTVDMPDGPMHARFYRSAGILVNFSQNGSTLNSVGITNRTPTGITTMAVCVNRSGTAGSPASQSWFLAVNGNLTSQQLRASRYWVQKLGAWTP